MLMTRLQEERRPGALLPQFPWEGPPLPRVTGARWPVTLDDVDKAVFNYRMRMQKAAEKYRTSLIMLLARPRR